MARRTAESLGWPDLRIVAMPQYLDDLSDDEVYALAEAKFDEIIGALTRPLG